MNTNRKLRDAAITQKGLISYMESQLRLVESNKSHAEEKLKQDPNNPYWDSLTHEYKMNIMDLSYYLELANEALKLMMEGISETEAPEL